MVTDHERCARDELAAVRRRFDAVVGRWALADGEAGALLGQGAWRDSRLTPDAEARLRLLLDVDGLLGLVLGDVAVADWVRAPNDAFVGRSTPLAAMSEGRHVIRGVRNVLEDIGEWR